jgi:dolichol-phosphate mannosyltransferase
LQQSKYKSLVIIPCYNEIENIHGIIQAVMDLEQSFHVLVVDDNSPDGTAQAVEKLQKHYTESLHLLKRPGKMGLGTAYIAGFKYALKSNYDFVFEMDADFSHNPNDLVRLLDTCISDQAHLVVGSRYVKGGQIENWPFDRKLLSYGASLYVRFITWMPVKDPTAGFICYKADLLRAFDLDKIKFLGYAFQIEMKYYAYLNKFKIVEIPITFIDRTAGTSKMNKSIISEAILGVLKLRWKGLMSYYKISS